MIHDQSPTFPFQGPQTGFLPTAPVQNGGQASEMPKDGGNVKKNVWEENR